MKRTSICAVFLAILMGFGTAGIGALASVADVQAAKYLNAYSNIEAGKCIKHADLTIKKEDSHKVITSIHNGSYAVFNINFSSGMSESWMTYQKYSIDLYKVKVTLRLDKKNGKKIATHKLASSSWDTATFSDNKPNIRGKHKVYMIFHTDNSLVPASESASAKTTIWFFGFKKAHIIGKPAKEKITTLEPGYYGTGSCMIKWKVLTENCSGYQYDFCENSSFKKGTYYRQTAKDPNTVGGGVTKLTVGKKYYVRVRAYHKANNQTRYGAWSKKRSFKAK